MSQFWAGVAVGFLGGGPLGVLTMAVLASSRTPDPHQDAIDLARQARALIHRNSMRERSTLRRMLARISPLRTIAPSTNTNAAVRERMREEWPQ